MEKPINLKAAELENEIIKSLNDSKLPAFILKPIVERVYNQVNQLEQAQLENSRVEYEKSLKKEARK